jgi:hypothetical protein
MKVTVELSEMEMKEIRRVTGERKKGPAIRRLMVDALKMRRREEIAESFISGRAGIELRGFEAGSSRRPRRRPRARQKVEGKVTWLIDSSLWIDFTRSRSPQLLKQFIPDAHALRSAAR